MCCVKQKVRVQYLLSMIAMLLSMLADTSRCAPFWFPFRSARVQGQVRSMLCTGRSLRVLLPLCMLWSPSASLSALDGVVLTLCVLGHGVGFANQLVPAVDRADRGAEEGGRGGHCGVRR